VLLGLTRPPSNAIGYGWAAKPRRLGLAPQLDPRILGLVGQPYPRILGVAPQLDPSFLPQAAGFS